MITNIGVGQRVVVTRGAVEECGVVEAVGINDRVPSREEVEKGRVPPECVEVRLEDGKLRMIPERDVESIRRA